MELDFKPEFWQVRGGKLRVEGLEGFYAERCAHRKASACEGCYARLYAIARLLVEGDVELEKVRHVAKEIVAAMDAEYAAARLKGSA